MRLRNWSLQSLPFKRRIDLVTSASGSELSESFGLSEEELKHRGIKFGNLSKRIEDLMYLTGGMHEGVYPVVKKPFYCFRALFGYGSEIDFNNKTGEYPEQPSFLETKNYLLDLGGKIKSDLKKAVHVYTTSRMLGIPGTIHEEDLLAYEGDLSNLESLRAS